MSNVRHFGLVHGDFRSVHGDSKSIVHDFVRTFRPKIFPLGNIISAFSTLITAFCTQNNHSGTNIAIFRYKIDVLKRPCGLSGVHDAGLNSAL